MKTAFVLPFIAAADVPLTLTWAEWKNQFGVVFNGDEEDSTRQSVYESNVAFIEAENSKGNAYVLGVNQFSHLAEEEFILQFTGAQGGGLASSDDTYMGELETGVRADSVDWTTTDGVVNAVKDQGHCGSCWAFSTIGTLESAYALASGQLLSLSEQQLVDCEDYQQSGCSGGYPNKALDYISETGSCSEETYPYNGQDFRDSNTCQAGNSEVDTRHGKQRDPTCTFALPAGVISGFSNVAKNVEGLESALNQGPVSVTIKADSTIQSYRSGVLSEKCGLFGHINHAVIAVGYDAETFKIRNSWSSTWGENGYFRIAKNIKNPYCIFQQNGVVPTMAAAAVTV